MADCYTKTDAVETRGLAILTMVCLHLFCRKGGDVFGTPLLWTSPGVPLVYWLGFICGICVPLYSICAGYAQELLFERKKTVGLSGYFSNLKRCGKLLLNLWIILILFTFLSLFAGTRSDMPTDLTGFVKAAFLIKYSNGAWWFLRTYILIMLVPPAVLLFPVRKINTAVGIILCFCLSVSDYLVGRLNLIPSEGGSFAVQLASLLIRLLCLLRVLPYFWLGAFVCKADLFPACDNLLKRFSTGKRVLVLGISSALFIAGSCILEKAVILDFLALWTFLAFNLMPKKESVQKIFCFLGKHSTNIWLVHMFFYCRLFNGLVQKAQYPPFIFLFLLLLCLVSSYVIMFIQGFVEKWLSGHVRPVLVKRLPLPATGETGPQQAEKHE